MPKDHIDHEEAGWQHALLLIDGLHHYFVPVFACQNYEDRDE